MRALIVATLLVAATTAAAHDCRSDRSCNGINNHLGACTTQSGGWYQLCASNSHANYDFDALMPVDRGCINIQPAYFEVLDNNGTTAMRNTFGGLSAGGEDTGVMSWNCGASTEGNPFCTKADANNMTYISDSSSSGTSSMSYDDANGVHRTCRGRVDISTVIPRQSATMYYGTDQDHSISVSRGSGLMSFTFRTTCSYSSGSGLNSNEKFLYLFRISNLGGSPFSMSLADGSRATANGLTFLEKAVETDVTGYNSNGHATYSHSWYSPSFSVVERYELNADTWKYEKHQFLAVSFISTRSTSNSAVLYATVGIPGEDPVSGVSSVATMAAALVAAVAALLVVA